MQARTATSVGVVGFLAIVFAASWVLTDQNSPKELRKPKDSRAGVMYLGSAGVVFQDRSNNCGVAALTMVLDHYGMKPSTWGIEKRTRPGFRGASLLTMKELAKSEGLEAEGWILSVEDLTRIQLPAILFIENNHFIVVDSVDEEGNLFVRDPAVGRLKIPPRKAVEIWKGEALVLTRESR